MRVDWMMKLTVSGVSCDLDILHINGTDGISTLFCYELQVTSSENLLEKDLINRRASVNIATHNSKAIYINAIISKLQRVEDSNLASVIYYLSLVPTLYKATKTKQSFIYHQKSVIDIVKSLLISDKVLPYNLSSTIKQYPIIDQLWQYQETNYQFIRRLLQLYKLYFYFEHSQHQHCLMLKDNQVVDHSEIVRRQDFIQWQYEARKEGRSPIIQAESNCVWLQSGMVIRFDRSSTQYLVIESQFCLNHTDGLRNKIQLQPLCQPVNSISSIPKPYVTNALLATVIGSQAKRVKLKFSEQCQCWAPVRYLSAGAQHGCTLLPSNGSRVLVDFMNGDPDKPVVIASLSNKPPDSSVAGWRNQDSTIWFQQNKQNSAVEVTTKQCLSVLVANDLKHDVSNGQMRHSAKQQISITAENKIHLQVGSSAILMDTAGISLQAEKIELN